MSQPPPPPELLDTSILEALRQAVYQSLAALGAHERREYDQAMAHVGSEEMIRREAPIEEFLWTEKYHPDRAALRLARYWKARKHAFGADRWLLPLVQTGHGALGAEELELLHSGYLVVIKRPGNKGIVTLVDKGRLQRTPTAQAVVRLCFYLTAVYGKDSHNGYISIHVERGVSRPPPLVSKDLFAIFNVAMPIPIWKRKVFVVQACYEPGKEILLDFMLFQIERTLQYNSGRRPTIIAGNSLRQTRLQLQEATDGVEAECLPYCLGGTYDYRMFPDWIRQRLSIESSQLGIPLSLPVLPSDNVDESTHEEVDDGKGILLLTATSTTTATAAAAKPAALPSVLSQPSTGPIHLKPPPNAHPN